MKLPPRILSLTGHTEGKIYGWENLWLWQLFGFPYLNGKWGLSPDNPPQ